MGVYSFHRNQFLCGLDWSKNKSFLLVFSIISFGLPVALESFCYIKIFFAAVGHSKRSSKVRPMGNRRSRIVSVTASSSCDFRSEASSGSSEYEENESGRKSKECKAVRTIFLIALVYIACWVPYFIDSFLTIQGDKVNANFSAAAICFLFSSSILNPVIYAYMNRVTRREMSRFVCGNSGVRDGDEAFSTSMSTHKSAWTHSKIRAKSNEGLNTDTMDTIVEETEVDDSIFSEPRSGNHLRTALCKTSTMLRSPRNGCIKHSERIVMQSKKVIELKPTRTNIGIDTEGLDNMKQVPGPSKEGCNLQLDNSKWSIVKANKLRDYQRRRSSLKDAESYFSKGRRRRKRDCGSFLFFEHDEDSQSKSTSGSKQKARHPQRYSLDQSISLGQFPGRMKLRLSLNESELAKLNKVTVKSDIEFKDDSYNVHPERPQSNPEISDIKNTTNVGNVYTTEHWPGQVSVWTSIRRNSPSPSGCNFSRHTGKAKKSPRRSDTSNSLQLSSTSPSQFVRLHSAPARCEQNNVSRKSRASKQDTLETSLSNQTHM
ncbi:5-hydroxytryptamine receptor 4 [Mactra antiquata]